MEVFTLDILCSTDGKKMVVKTVTNVVSFKCRCVQCAKSFSAHAALQLHIRNTHLVTAPPPAVPKQSTGSPYGGVQTSEKPVLNRPVVQAVPGQLIGTSSTTVLSTATNAASLISGQFVGNNQMSSNVSYPVTQGMNPQQSNCGIQLVSATSNPMPSYFVNTNNMPYPVVQSNSHQLQKTSTIPLVSVTGNPIAAQHGIGTQSLGSVPYSFLQGANQLQNNVVIPLSSSMFTPMSTQNVGTSQLSTCPINNLAYTVQRTGSQVQIDNSIPLVSTKSGTVSKIQIYDDQLVKAQCADQRPESTKTTVEESTDITDIKIEPADEDLKWRDTAVINTSADDLYVHGDNVGQSTSLTLGLSDSSETEAGESESKTCSGNLDDNKFTGGVDVDAGSNEEDKKPVLPVALFVSEVTTVETSVPSVCPIGRDATIDQCHVCGENMPTLRALQQHQQVVHELNHDDIAMLNIDQSSHLTGKEDAEKVKITKVAVCVEDILGYGSQDRGKVECNINAPSTSTQGDGKPLNSPVDFSGANTKPVVRKFGNKLYVYPSLLDARNLTCSICGKTMSTPAILRNHIHLKHSGEKSFVCDICEKGFARKCDFNRHVTIHGRDKNDKEEKTFSCPECKLVFTSARLMDLHIVKHHGDAKPFGCEFCQKRFQTSRGLLRHSRVHDPLYVDPAKNLTCSICGKTLSTPGSLQNHFHLKHSGEKPFVCDICEKDFARRCDFNRHVAIHGRDKRGNQKKTTFPCPVCDFIFKSSRRMDMHIIEQHVDAEPFCCEVCKKRFQTARGLQQHGRIHDPGQPLIKKMLCHLCGVQVKRTMYYHWKVYHSERRPVACPTCGKKFICRTNLIVHSRSHTGEKPYKCNVCGRSFARNSVLIVHKRGHTGERPYRCTVCEKGFTNGSDLLKHARIHTEPKKLRQYRCPHRRSDRGSICGRTFAHRKSYIRHCKDSHGIENPVIDDLAMK